MEEFFRTEIAEFINNTEDEIYCKLTDEEIERVVKDTITPIMCDNEMNSVITQTIEWYVNKYIYNSDLYMKYKGE